MSRQLTKNGFLVSFLAAAVSVPGAICQWPQFRGPGGNGLAGDQSIPLGFGPRTNLLWKVPLPPGHSSPCISGDRIFLTGHEGQTLKLLAVRRSDGKVLWERTKKLARLPVYAHIAGSPANSTPATDGHLAVFYFDDFGVVVTDLQGKVKWEKRLAPTPNPFSYGASPILDNGCVYLNRDGALDSSLLCLDAATGKERWRAPRTNTVPSFCSPYILKNDSSKRVLVGGSGRLQAYDTASGAPIWQVTGLPAWVCASPVAADGMVFFGGWATAHVSGRSRIESLFDENSGVSPESLRDPVAFFAQFDKNKDGRLSFDEFPKRRARDAFPVLDLNRNGFIELEEWALMYSDYKPLPGRNVFLGIASGGSGDVTATHVKWETTKGLPYVASPLVYRGRVYLVKDGGFLTCLDAATGRPHYEAERLGVGGDYYATPVAVGEHILVCAQRGTVFLVRAGDHFEIIASNALGEAIYATPAVVENTLYLRGDEHLWAFGK
jgi:outer membrane protein assembly factor BamB